MKKITRFIVTVFFTALIGGGAFAGESPWQKGSFSTYINGDGSSFEEAVIIDIPGDLKKCGCDECYQQEFSKIIREEHSYLAKTYGKEGSDWWIAGETNMSVDIDMNDKFYDKIAIRMSSLQEPKIIYFDITRPFKKIDWGYRNPFRYGFQDYDF